MPKHYHTDWKLQFGDPILPPEKPKKKKGARVRRGSWKNPSKSMLERELKKCRITKIDPVTGEVVEVVDPTTKRKPATYGETGRAPTIPRKR
jgi:hypothetical protein